MCVGGVYKESVCGWVEGVREGVSECERVME